MLRCGARTTSAWEAARVRHHRSMRSAPRTGAYASVRIIVRCANAPTPHTSRILRTYRTTHVPAHVHTPCMQHTCPTAAACANLGRGDDDKAPQRLHQKAMVSLLSNLSNPSAVSRKEGRRPAPARCAAAKRYPPPTTHSHAHTHMHTTPSQHCTRDTGEGHSQGL